MYGADGDKSKRTGLLNLIASDGGISANLLYREMDLDVDFYSIDQKIKAIFAL